MANNGFVHLHVHTQYSISDGLIRIQDLVNSVSRRKIKAVGMTDHGNMHGAVDFYKKAKKTGVKPILGIELNMHGALSPKNPNKRYHLTLLAKNLVGYKNMVRLNSKANIEGYDNFMQTGYAEFSWLKEYSEGLICLSGDLGSEISQAILADNDVKALIAMYRDSFEDGAFYLELMDNSFPEQQVVNDKLIELGRELGLPLVATNDCHYLERREALAQAVLVCNALSKQLAIEQLERVVKEDFYLKSDDEMYKAFAHCPEACENTVKIAESIDFELPLGKVFLPHYAVPKAFCEQHNISDHDEAIHAYFREKSREGLQWRLSTLKAMGKEPDETAYKERLEREISVICSMDFPGYFLIVWDFIRWAKDRNIPVGPGRGSGAGSLVAYSLAITDIDPMPYNLLFERFLNPERVSMPDFDIDFCMNRRGEVINYVSEKYGVNNVAQIATFGAFKAKAALKAVARVMGISPSEANALSKLVPNALDITLSAALSQERKLREIVETQAQISKLYALACDIEGCFNSVGMHAAGVVISDEPLWEYVPVCRGAKNEIVSQYAKDEVEQAGLVKFDFLGLKNLTAIELCLEMVNKERAEKAEPPLILGQVAMDKEEVFKLISDGDTAGIFQLESSGFRSLLLQLKPDCFEDIVSAVALYRPGPMQSGMVNDFVQCKHGLQRVEYPHPLLEPVLKETYGVIVYQEQVMQCAQILSSYSLGAADIMRRAMGKKKVEEMLEQRSIFVDGAVKNGVDAEKAGAIFDNIEKFAGYGFNKSHSAAYGLITYYTAYLKAFYPVEFAAALMTTDSDDANKVVFFINDARKHAIAVLPPDVNQSSLAFNAVDGKIRFGLGGIKGIGTAAIENILEARAEAPFSSLFDFCKRVDLQKINRRVIVSLVSCGAFDSTWEQPLTTLAEISAARARIFAAIDSAIERGQKEQQDQASGQSSLFSFMAKSSTQNADIVKDRFPETEAWQEKYCLELEKQILGFFVSGHPLDAFAHELSLYITHDSNSIKFAQHNEQVTMGGLLCNIETKTTRKGDKMAVGGLEDCSGQAGILIFPKTYAQHEELLASEEPVIIKGRARVEGDEEQSKVEVSVDSIERLEELRERLVKQICFIVNAEDASSERLLQLKTLLQANRGRCRSSLRVCFDNSYKGYESTLPLEKHPVSLSDALLRDARRLLGGKAFEMHT